MTTDQNALLLAAAAGLDAETAQLQIAERNLAAAKSTWQNAAATHGRAEPALVEEAYAVFLQMADAKDAQQRRFDDAYQKYVTLVEAALRDPALD